MPVREFPEVDPPTAPDPIDRGARDELDLLPGERIARCWRTGVGFLVMTNLRCVHVWRRPELFVRSDWHTGPSFFFYEMGTPRVVARRFVELAAGARGSDVELSRFLVGDPAAVAREVDAARPAGRAEWAARRVRVAHDLPRLGRPQPPPGTPIYVREVVKVRCSFCGNLMDEAVAACPSCGAPQR